MELKQYNLFFLYQETFALTKRLFIQLKRRPSTLLAGILQPIIWLFLFGALFSKAPEGFLPGIESYGNFLGAGLIVFTAFSGALNSGLPLMFDREFGFLNRLLVAPLTSRLSIVLSSFFLHNNPELCSEYCNNGCFIHFGLWMAQLIWFRNCVYNANSISSFCDINKFVFSVCFARTY